MAIPKYPPYEPQQLLSHSRYARELHTKHEKTPCLLTPTEAGSTSISSVPPQLHSYEIFIADAATNLVRGHHPVNQEFATKSYDLPLNSKYECFVNAKTFHIHLLSSFNGPIATIRKQYEFQWNWHENTSMPANLNVRRELVRDYHSKEVTTVGALGHTMVLLVYILLSEEH
ncbi:hypothetical protein BJ508DRAFT_306552 [Ascobolus immersus RN42]|uniref:Uncharacterized protein n=1 Tax=Ascobolus immersus RN42 TaxID=1160509 RepID=A0A3N4IA06_ASCIM|nr:hypothetical protein BJ508DRAFT_306552 [Ascobolus immersus RN42]